LKEQEVTDNLLKFVIDNISETKDLLERKFILEILQEPIKQYVMNMEELGLFDKWWDEPILQDETKKFFKNPKQTAISTLKQEVFGSINGEVYTLFFHLRCRAEFYYLSISEKKISYLVNSSRLIYVKLDKFDRERGEDVTTFEQERDQIKKLLLPLPNGQREANIIVN